jgi:putative transposase
MCALPLLTVGLVIERDGALLECVTDLGERFQFKDLTTGVLVGLEVDEILKGIALQTIRVCESKVAPDYVDVFENEEEERSYIELSAKNQRRLDIRLAYIKGIEKRGITRGQLNFLAEASNEITQEINSSQLLKDEKPYVSPSVQTLNRWMARYEKNRQQIAALIPKTAFRETAKRIDPENEKLIQEVFDTKLFGEGVGRIPDLLSHYDDLLDEYNNNQRAVGGVPLLSVGPSTLIRRFYEISSYERDVAINGVQAARVNHRVAKGHLPSEFALQFVETDHGQLDLYAIDDLLFVPLGVPWITIFRDRHTGIVLGFYISFRKTSLQSIFGALRHSITPHCRVRELWPDITEYWPSGFGYIYVSDRGADYLSPRYRLAIRQFGSDVQYAARRTPWHKGPIERFIGTANKGLVETLPGKTYPFRKAPPHYDARKQAVIRFSTLVYLLNKWVAQHYHLKAHSRKLASPLSRWEKSISEMPIPLPPGPESFLVLTGEQHQRKLSQEGFVHNWLNYTSPILEDICEQMGRPEITFISNPENLGYGMAIDPRTSKPFRVDCMSPDYANGLSEAMHQYIRRSTKIKLNRENAHGVLMQRKREIQEQLAEEILAKDSADKARLHQAAIRAGINSNAVLDGKPKSVADILSAVQRQATPRDNPLPTEQVGSTDVPHFACI